MLQRDSNDLADVLDEMRVLPPEEAAKLAIHAGNGISGTRADRQTASRFALSTILALALYSVAFAPDERERTTSAVSTHIATTYALVDERAVDFTSPQVALPQILEEHRHALTMLPQELIVHPCVWTALAALNGQDIARATGLGRN